MTNIRIINSTIKDVYVLADNLREEDRREIEADGKNIYRAIRDSYRNSNICKSVFVGEELAAMFGVGGVLLSDKGAIWLLTTNVVQKVSPLKFARIYQEQVLEMLKYFSKLENYVDASYTSSIRLLELIGFTVHAPEPLGEHGNLFCKYTMRAA